MRVAGRRSASRIAALAAALALLAPPPASAIESRASRLAEYKRMERAILLDEAAEELREGPVVARIARELRRRRDLDETGPPVHGPLPGAGLSTPLETFGGSTPTNVRLNDRATEQQLFSTQAEPGLAAIGLTAVAGWNDGEDVSVTGSGVTVGASRDGGVTWRKVGPLPRGDQIGLWTSDPVVTADAARSRFLLTALLVTVNSRNGVGVVPATFADTGLVLGPPLIVRSVRDTLPDKPWLAADPVRGRMYLAYTAFFGGGTRLSDQIELQRSEDGGFTWAPPIAISPPAEAGLVHGARVVVGPDGEVHVAWKTIDTTQASHGRDWIRIRTSRDGGIGFGPLHTVSDMFTNFGSGAPGYNRPYGFAFPALAVDRSRGPYRGRLYAAWNESVSIVDDSLGAGTTVLEQEPNGIASNATLMSVGQTLLGTLNDPSDVDLWHFTAQQGQTGVFLMDSVDARLDLSMRLFCADAHTVLAYSADGGRRRTIVFTFPATGDYYLRIAQNGTAVGGYRILSAFHRPTDERARDHRDVFVAHSDDGFRWSTPERVNDDPPWFDDWLPEIGVSASGKVVVAWYDWRRTPSAFCGGWSDNAASVSSDGGETWGLNETITDTPTRWTDVLSNQAPNQGDYIGLSVSGDSAWVAWADGRLGDPDIMAAVLGLGQDPAPPPISRPLAFDGPWPHPASGPLTLRLWLPDQREANIALLDASGRSCRTLRLHPSGPGWQWVDLETAGLRPGLYFVHAEQGAATASKKIVLLR